MATAKMNRRAKKVGPVKAPVAQAVHLKHRDGMQHIVGLGNIRVLIFIDAGAWIAHGLEIDYVAQGDTIEDAKHEFEDGLEASVNEHLRVFGDLKKFLVVAPQEMWALANDPRSNLELYSQVTHHQVIQENTKYEGIAYLLATQSQATC